MLRPRERRFVEEYLKDFNATAAAVRAGYSPLSHYGRHVVRRPHVQAAIAEAAASLEHRVLVDGRRLIGELMVVAFSDIRNYLVEGENGAIALKPFDELAPAETAAIAAYTPGTNTRGATLRLRSKKEALRALARHVGLNDRRATIDPKALIEETARVRAKVLRAAGIDPESVLPPPLEDE